MDYGLIGEKLGHSFSKIIHEQLADYTYDLHPIEKDKLDEFMTKKEFKAINVTIPYKKAVIPYLDEIDEAAEKIGAVNTIVNTDGKLKGYNTDYTGFVYSVQSHNVDFNGKEVLVIGNGGAAQAIKAAARNLGAAKLYVVDLYDNGEEPDFITYEEVPEHYDVDIIINCTPVGMYPNVDAQAIDLRNFSACQAVFDCIYNPLRTKLLKEADDMGITAVNGLQMLVAQAKFAVEHFLQTEIDNSRIDDILKALTKDLANIVLIGMPSSGKSYIGKALSKKIDKKLVEVDQLIVEKTGMEITKIFEKFGEDYFRAIEADITAELAKGNGQIISTGGGVIKRPENMLHLKQNGVIVFLDRDLKNLVSTSDRPLSSTIDKVKELYRQRYPVYLSHSDVKVENNHTGDEDKADLDKIINQIMEGYNAIIDHQWT